jgi:CheY-like chemotaxis protein
MDMQLPTMGGLEATRQMRQCPGCAMIPILAVTGNAFREDHARCLEAGMNDVMVKPIGIDEMFTKSLHWLSQNKLSQ